MGAYSEESEKDALEPAPIAPRPQRGRASHCPYVGFMRLVLAAQKMLRDKSSATTSGTDAFPLSSPSLCVRVSNAMSRCLQSIREGRLKMAGCSLK